MCFVEIKALSAPANKLHAGNDLCIYWKNFPGTSILITMAPCWTQTLTLLLVLLTISASGHKKHRRGLQTTEIHRQVRNATCPPPLGILKVQSQSDHIAGITNQGGLNNLLFMCGTTQVPYQAPTKWVMREGPNGALLNVTIYETRYKMIPLCCPGYARNNKDICSPKCKGNCENGLCLSPENCVCYEGYALNNLGKCAVTCPCECPNGQCQGNTCVCNHGYVLNSDGVCNAICINECVNGDCSAPNQCTCHFGYKKKKNQDSHICSPHCTLPCTNGKCVKPDICKCNEGYGREKNTGRCIPKCTGCDNGDCVAPYTCHCHKGYKRENEDCAPVCTGGCYNATCTNPNECTCFKGFKHTTPRTCVPNCNPECQNARCTAPNTCECYSGFMKKPSSPSYNCVSVVGSAIQGVGNIVNHVRHR